MGEVYRARDTRLNRTVAVKVLPASVCHCPRCGRDSSARPRQSPVATIYAGLDDTEHVLEWLERAYVQKDPMLALDLATMHVCDGLRDDPRFVEFHRRVFDYSRN